MRKLILRCGLAPGDIVMLTAAVRDLHQCYPRRFLTDVRTVCPEIWANNPYLTPLSEQEPGVEEIDCSYPLINVANRVPCHCLQGFIEFLNRRLHLRIQLSAVKGDIHLSDLEKSWFSQVREVTGGETPFWIIAAGGKYDVTVKWWPAERYQRVVDHFRGRIQFAQVGRDGHHHPKLDGVIDLRGRTNLRELIRLVYHAQGVLCPITALMHLAAAVESKDPSRPLRPCVVLAGGREPVHWESYPGHQFIHTIGALACCRKGGCWKDRTIRLRDGDERDHRRCLCARPVGEVPQCMDMLGAEEVIRRLQLYYQGKALRFMTPREQTEAKRGVAATRKNNYDRQSLNLHNAAGACDSFIRSIPPYPGGFEGRGIVICGGTLRYFTNAWVCIRMLRKLGCKLPIELWHLGKRELDPQMEALVAPYGVRCVDAVKVRRKHPARLLHGWALKPYAVLRSAFRQVLFLDADNVPVRNPEFLFDSAAFKAHGSIFWPDYGQRISDKALPVWRSCGVRRPPEPEFETGQLVVDKQRCWGALCLTVWFNENRDFYYRYLHGDKETFHLAFRRVRKSYGLVSSPIETLSGTMCQHDFKERRLFQHRNGDKWDYLLCNHHVRGFRFEQTCRSFVLELRRLWDAGAGAFVNGTRPQLVTAAGPPSVQAVMISCAERAGLRSRTLANLAQTDWIDLPLRIQMDRGAGEDRHQRQTACAFAALTAARGSGDYILFLEDDLDFNRHLRHNLYRWLPFRQRTVALASLYNPGLFELACDQASNSRIVAPDMVFGSQALLISQDALEHIVANWHRVPGMQDIKISRLASHFPAPVLYHAPSLVQHIGEVSISGGGFHRARDFDGHWRAA